MPSAYRSVSATASSVRPRPTYASTSSGATPRGSPIAPTPAVGGDPGLEQATTSVRSPRHRAQKAAVSAWWAATLVVPARSMSARARARAAGRRRAGRGPPTARPASPRPPTRRRRSRSARRARPPRRRPRTRPRGRPPTPDRPLGWRGSGPGRPRHRAVVRRRRGRHRRRRASPTSPVKPADSAISRRARGSWRSSSERARVAHLGEPGMPASWSPTQDSATPPVKLPAGAARDR